MKIIIQPKVILTAEEVNSLNATIRLMEDMSMNLKNYDGDLTAMANEAWSILTDICADEAVDVE